MIGWKALYQTITFFMIIVDELYLLKIMHITFIYSFIFINLDHSLKQDRITFKIFYTTKKFIHLI